VATFFATRPSLPFSQLKMPPKQQRSAAKKKKMPKSQPKKSRGAQAQRAPAQRPRQPRQRAALGLGPLRLGGGRDSNVTTRRSQVIEEDEYIGEVAGSVAFATTGYACNPGQALVFPWGNKVASLYEEYEFEMLEFYYKREVSEFSTNGQAGKVMLSFDFNAGDPAPLSKQQVEDSVPHVDGMPCTPVIRLPIDCALLRRNLGKFVRAGAQPANTDIKTFDAGRLYVSTFGNTNTSTIGELRVRYRVKLIKPVLEFASGDGGAVHFSSITATTVDNFAGVALQNGSTPALTGITAASNAVVLPSGIPGNYMLTLAIAGATSATAVNIGASGGVSGLSIMTKSAVRDAGPAHGSVAGATTSPYIAVYAFTLTAAGGSVLLTTPSTITGEGSVDLFIVSIPPTLLTSARGPTSLTSSDEQRLLRLERMLLRIDEEEDDYPPPASASSASAAAAAPRDGWFRRASRPPPDLFSPQGDRPLRA
jgi:hypothetical protein